MKHHENIEQILEEYQAVYDSHMRLVDHTRRSTKVRYTLFSDVLLIETTLRINLFFHKKDDSVK